MNFKDDEEAFNLLNHLMEKFQQMNLKQHGYNFNFVYVASGATHIENQHNYYGKKEKQDGYSDEQIAQAIKAINGSKKPLNSKRKWAAVYWCLKWYCNFPANVSDFCDRVNGLPLGGLEYECDYNNIRRECALTFMDQDARYMDKVKPSKADNDFFQQCREVVLALVTELGKAALPQIDMG